MKTELAYKKGKSDKVYNIEISSTSNGQFVVNFEYGRRGSKLRPGTKTPNPVSRVKAITIHDDLMREKLTKGYYVVKQHSSLPTSPPPTPAAVSGQSGLMVPAIPFQQPASIVGMLDSTFIGLQVIPTTNQVLIEWQKQKLKIYSFGNFSIEPKLESSLTESFLRENLGDTVLRGFIQNSNVFFVDALILDSKDIQRENTVNRYLMLKNFAHRFNLIIAQLQIDKANKHLQFNAPDNSGKFLLRQLNQPFNSHDVGEWFAYNEVGANSD
ncbi:MAG TPA: WGR domain-containing protein [Pyrinomonadaceae bacterium]|nr:WGR domain-containing protein [Pyrinomonadaceae bacterium]